MTIRSHFRPFGRADFAQLEQKVTPERVPDSALDECDPNQPFAAGHWQDLVQRVRGIEDRLARLELERQLGVADADLKLAPVIIGGIAEEDGAG